MRLHLRSSPASRLLAGLAAIATLGLPGPLAAQPAGGLGQPAPLPSAAELKTALTLSDQQVAQIAPLLDAINQSQQAVATAQTRATAATTTALAAIGTTLNPAQQTQLTTLLAALQPQRGGGGRGGRGGAAYPAANTLPYLVQPALGGMRFDKPLGMVTAPGEPRSLYILEKETGQIIRIADVTKPEKAVFLDISAEIGDLTNERGLLALAFHPNYQRNRFIYVWFTATSADGTESYDRLARFTVGADGKADPKSEQRLISQLDRAVNHNGGELAFGPDGYLYLSLGDEGNFYGEWQNTQLVDKNFFSGLIRIDVDKKPGSLPPNPHPAVHEGSYTVPADNPWVNATTFNGRPVDPKKVRTEFWAVGFRNPWRFTFDPVTKLLWLADVGQDRQEEINLVRGGGNYGWNFREGTEAYQIPPYRGVANRAYSPLVPPPPDPDRVKPETVKFDDPVFIYYHPGLAPAGDINTGASVTGGIVYRGNAQPALAGRYLFADYNSSLIWALGPVTADKDYQLTAKPTIELIARRAGIVTFAQDPVTGDVLVANYTSGLIERLVPNPSPAPAATPAAAPAPARGNP
jgi:glucose/arabinose dehydrogenase